MKQVLYGYVTQYVAFIHAQQYTQNLNKTRTVFSCRHIPNVFTTYKM